jgi:hypothetical protein
MLFEGRPCTVLYARGSSVRIRLADGKERTVEASRVKPARKAPDIVVVGNPPRYGKTHADKVMAAIDDGIILLARASDLRPVPKPPSPLRSSAYLAFVREHDCCMRSSVFASCDGPIEAHHFGPRGMSQKTDDFRTVALCQRHHREFHDTGTVDGLSREETEAAFIYDQRCMLIEWFDTNRENGEMDIVTALIAHIRESG